MRLIIIFGLVLFSKICVNGQTLSLEDILRIRTMDSVELISFSRQKGFELKLVDLDPWRSAHKYCSTDSSIWFERNFPTGRKMFSQSATTSPRDNRHVYYHYSNKETLKEFKQEVKEKGFKFKRNDIKDYGGFRSTRDIYLTNDIEIHLVSEKQMGQKLKYILQCYPRMN